MEVAELLDEDQHWKEDLIYKHSELEDVEAIMQIPLSRRPNKDQLIWHYNKRGQYSVKSGYQVAMKIKFLDYPSCSAYTQDLLPTIENL